MSNKNPKEQLDEILREARADLTSRAHGPRSDWSKVDGALFDRIDGAGASGAQTTEADQIAARLAAESASGASATQGSRFARRGWIAVGLIAAAASVAVVLHRPDTGRGTWRAIDSTSTNELASAERRAGSLTSREGTGDIRVDGAPIEAGKALAVGDTIDTGNARASFASGSDPQRSVLWSLEATTHVAVRRAESPLVLALDHGAVEAQVTPVPNGEAFAIDVDLPSGPNARRLRIAVHGTHFRVAREGTHVTIDLTEGILSIGTPPRSGSTYGTLVNAPAHVDIDLTNPVVQVDHDLAHVRPATPPALASGGSLAAQGAHVDPAQPQVTPPSAAGDHSHETQGTPQGIVSSPAAAGSPPIAQGAADAHAEQTVTTAVKACALKHLRAADVRVTVSSKLSLRVGDDGLVTFARFDPPLAPAAQSCAAASIYKTRFPRGGAFEIPIEVAPPQ
ncbi:MAG: hypothetical protein JWM74_247 [Myxococcaceae bacterium]|nr:hypothetical protein [Myxococcaceae bacterium]